MSLKTDKFRKKESLKLNVLLDIQDEEDEGTEYIYIYIHTLQFNKIVFNCILFYLISNVVANW